MRTNKTLGLTCAILAATIYGCTGILAKVTYSEGCNTLTLTMFRSLFSIPVLYLYLKGRGISLRVTKKQFGMLILLGIMGATLTSLLLYGSYNLISVGLTTCIHFVYPVIVAVVSVAFFKDKISKAKVISILLSVVGLTMFLEKNMDVNMTGVILAFLSGVSYAIYVLAMDKGGVRELHPMAIAFYCCCVAAILLFGYGTATSQLVYDITLKGWIFMFIMAMCVSVGANSMIPVAVKHVGGTVTSIMGMFEPISTVILGYFVLNEVMTFRGLVGCVLVIAAVMILTLESAMERKKRIK